VCAGSAPLVCLIVSGFLWLMKCLGKSLIAPSRCPIGLMHSHPPAPCVLYGRWQTQVHTLVLRCLARVSPHSSLPWRAFLTSDQSDFQSLSGSSTGSLSRQPSSHSRTAADATVFNQTIVYPGYPWVTASGHGSSLRRTTSITDLSEELNLLCDGPKTRDLDWASV